jgi:hypothetical protein
MRGTLRQGGAPAASRAVGVRPQGACCVRPAPRPQRCPVSRVAYGDVEEDYDEAEEASTSMTEGTSLWDREQYMWDNSYAINNKNNQEPDFNDPEWYKKVTVRRVVALGLVSMHHRFCMAAVLASLRSPPSPDCPDCPAGLARLLEPPEM